MKALNNLKINSRFVLAILTFAFAVCAVVCFNGAPTQSARADEIFFKDWVVHERAESLTVSDVEEGGVGRISYYAVTEEGTEAVPLGHTAGPIYNSVRIPCKWYDPTQPYLSIKYAANFPISGHNITVYACVSADIGSDGSDLDAAEVLVGWFENWNVTSGQTKDGYKYITINTREYTNSRTINGVVLQFNYEGDASEEKVINLYGIDLHGANEKPEFATDPKPFTVSDFTGNGCNVIKAEEYTKIETSGYSSVNCTLNHWDGKLYDRLVLDIKAFEGAVITPSIDGADLASIELDSVRSFYEIPVSSASVCALSLAISGNGDIYIYSIGATTAPKATNYSTSNSEYFSQIEAVSDGVYQMRYTRTEKAGYPKVIISFENWRADYDVICVDVNVISGKTLLGILLADQKYLLSHWKADSMLTEGKYQFAFYYPLSLDPTWDGSRMIMYVNPNSISEDGYTYDSTFEIGISFMRSAALPKAQITTEKDSYVYDYDGTPKSVNATVTPADAALKVSYLKDGKVLSGAPTDAGEYTVKFEVEGTRELRYTVKEVSLVIKALTQTPPSADSYGFDYKTGTLMLEGRLEASYSPQFDVLVVDGAEVTPGGTLYIRKAGDGGKLPSESVEVKIPSKPDGKVEIEIEKVTKTGIQVKSEPGIEYRIISAGKEGEWKDEGKFIGLSTNTLYRIQARIKATDTSFAGDIVTVPVRTLTSSGQTDNSSTSSDSSSVSEDSTSGLEGSNSQTDSGEQGCGASVMAMQLPILMAVACVLLKKKRI